MSDLVRTMTTVRDVIDAIVEALRDQGYVFAHPKRAFVAPRAGVSQRVDAIEARVGPIPPALRAAWEIVGSYDLTGSHPDWPVTACLMLPGAKEGPGGVWMTDSIVLYSPTDVLARLDDAEDEFRDRVPVWPDAHHKAGYSGSPETCVAIPSNDPDAELIEGDPNAKRPPTLVAYLRWALTNFGGFPGFSEIGADKWPALTASRNLVVPF